MMKYVLRGFRGLRRREEDTQEMDRQGLVSHSGRFGRGSYIPCQSSGIHTRNAPKKDRKKQKDYRSMTRKRPSHLVSYIRKDKNAVKKPETTQYHSYNSIRLSSTGGLDADGGG